MKTKKNYVKPEKSSKSVKEKKKKTQHETNSSENKRNDRPRTKVKGWLGPIFVESIEVDGFPKFLCYDKNSKKIFITNQLEYHDITFKPIKQSDCGYNQYSFSDNDLNHLLKKEITIEYLLDHIKQLVDTYISADSITKCLIQVDLLLTYCQELIKTTHFPFLVGETESGKSSVLHLFKFLAYRCLYGVNIPTANIYHFLGNEEEGTGTIAEDEAQEIWKDSEKLRLYKNSYSRGDKQARMLMLSYFQKQVYYRTFCFKLFAGERVPFDRGFVERLAIVNMIQGEPEANIKLVSKEQEKSLNKLRNMMLIWKVQNLEREFPSVSEPKLQGRDEELWSDFLKLVNDTKYFNQAVDTVNYFKEQRHKSISDSFDARLFAAVLNNLNSSYQLDFEPFWEKITNNKESEIQIDSNTSQTYSYTDTKKQTYYDADTGEKITKPSISKTLKEKFHGRKIVTVDQEAYGQKRKTSYHFKEDELQKLANKYKKTFKPSLTGFG